ncbi:FFLEELY motif protein [Acanthopleuribacter pedis]|uniref:DUF8198 domain-containing protein n=1 Tax=Acanthopleuribacter pedis TaxID=442870 RepID=A0A8J7QG32_9BACT|nr:hypothetical protein [Acanthopleuribacter pedis]MBO1321645.1 hypothetical protein [Acanthopleuribacter pedis]
MSNEEKQIEFEKVVEDPKYFYLKDFQSKRLRSTYDDFASQPEYASACFFFFYRIYSVEDTEDRDRQFRKIHGTVKNFLGGEVVNSMSRLIELQDLTIQLDMKLLAVLAEMEAPVSFDVDTYERAYKMSDNYVAREKQIELLDFTIRLIHSISHRFGIGMILKGLRAACLVLGHTAMVDFLMDGYRAFADLRAIDPLAEAMVAREQRRLDRIWAIPLTS